MTDMKKILLSALVLCGLTFMTDAKVSLPAFFADDMVLQQQTDAVVWGTAKPDTKVVITTTWSKDKTVVRSDPDGRWSARIATPVAGGPYEITFSDGERLTLKNVLVGEVWICSGQSNMEMPLKGLAAQPVAKSADMILGADPAVPIRACKIHKAMAFEPQDSCAASWFENRPSEIGDASAVAYFFAKKLYECLRVPVGVIDVSWGGTPIEAWMSADVLKEGFASEFGLSHLENRVWPEKQSYQAPAALYNGMMHPLEGLAIKGFLWYQGCSNRHNPEQYKRLQPAFVKMLRDRWNDESLPFYFVQIAPYKHNTPDMMWAQAQTVAMIPNSGMAATHDVGERNCIHPARKQEVGDRLAYLALTNDYGLNYIDAKTPIAVKFEFADGEAVVSFDVGELGLSPRSTDLDGFELAGEDGVFHPAKANVVRGTNRIKVSKCPQVAKPVAVRYAWSRWCPPTLFNCSGIPASPFASDK